MADWPLMAGAALTGLAVGLAGGGLLLSRWHRGRMSEASGSRDRMREELQASEARYRLLAENATDVIWTLSLPDLRYTYVSPSITRLRGVSVEQAMTEKLTDSIVPEQREWISRLIDQRVRAYRTGRFDPDESKRVQVRQLCADGSEKVVEIIASLVVDEDGDIAAIQGISRDVSNRVRAEEERQAREAILHGLASAARTLLNATDKDAVVTTALSDLGLAVGVDRVYVFENHRHAETGQLLASQRYEWCGPGIQSELDNPDMQGMAYDEVIPNWRPILESGEIVSGLVSEMSEPERSLLEPQNIRSIVVVPIFLDGRFWGQIGFDDCSNARQWSQPEIDALEIAAGVIGGAINSLRVEDELRRLVSTDSLTGVSSRRAFLEQARAMIAGAGPASAGAALMIMDLDHFKSINDSHGHPVGDEALKLFARICRQTLRQDDLIGRTGGEEFAVMLKNADLDQAVSLAEKLRTNVAAEPMAVDGVELNLTVSIGVAGAAPGSTDLSNLLKRADKALYRAKKKGRNRVEPADQP